jgi:hypothetical protein
MFYFILGYTFGLYTFTMFPEILKSTQLLTYLENYMNDILNKYQTDLQEDRSNFLNKISNFVIESNQDINKINEKIDTLLLVLTKSTLNEDMNNELTKINESEENDRRNSF